MFKEYERKIINILESNESKSWGKVLAEHKEMILIIQHERLIHLLVTIFVGIVLSLCCLFTIIYQNNILLLLDIPLVLLFVGYIFHYRFLENTTQSWYRLTEKIKKQSD